LQDAVLADGLKRIFVKISAAGTAPTSDEWYPDGLSKASDAPGETADVKRA
jgi:hypothetical protein